MDSNLLLCFKPTQIWQISEGDKMYLTPEKKSQKNSQYTLHMNQGEKWHLQGKNFPVSRMLFPGKREGQKSGISREFPGANSTPTPHHPYYLG